MFLAQICISIAVFCQLIDITVQTSFESTAVRMQKNSSQETAKKPDTFDCGGPGTILLLKR